MFPSLAGAPSGSPVLLVGPQASPAHWRLRSSVSKTPKPLFNPDFSPKSRTHKHKGPLNTHGGVHTNSARPLLESAPTLAALLHLEPTQDPCQERG